MQELNGKVAVVTGGGSGIGRAMALAFADEGMDVAIGDIEAAPAEAVAEEIRAKGRRAISVTCDVVDIASVRGVGGDHEGGAGRRSRRLQQRGRGGE